MIFFFLFYFPLEDLSLIDSDVDGLTDITVSSVHTSDLSSFEEDTEEEVVMSDSMEEGEITSDGKAFYIIMPLKHPVKHYLYILTAIS